MCVSSVACVVERRILRNNLIHLSVHQSIDFSPTTGYFEALASLLKTEAPSLCAEASFIFVPGPHDPGACVGGWVGGGRGKR